MCPDDLNRHEVPSSLRTETRDAPDLSVLRFDRRPPPELDLSLFSPIWAAWISKAAAAAACPVDYVVAPLLAAASTIIGNARWAQATEGWVEPPHLWCASVGDSGQGKSPGADIFYRHLLPPIERRMEADFAGQLEEFRRQKEFAEVRKSAWRALAREAEKSGQQPPPLPDFQEYLAPVSPRLVSNDATIERVAELLACAAPKGLLMVRDELAGWFKGMNSYNSGSRPFWIEAYGGRPYKVDRISRPESIAIPRLVVGWHGGIQPARLAEVMSGPDDGLLSRWCWFWPDPIRFKLGTVAPDVSFAAAAFERLGLLEMREGLLAPEPLHVPIAGSALPRFEAFGIKMQECQEEAGGLLISALGKARGMALRLSLVLEHLWWSANPGLQTSPTVITEPPRGISEAACEAAIAFVEGYVLPMAERVYGDAAQSPESRNATTLARWIRKECPREVHIRHLQREVRLPGLASADAIRKACDALVEARWLTPPLPSGGSGRNRVAYRVRPELLNAFDPGLDGGARSTCRHPDTADISCCARAEGGSQMAHGEVSIVSADQSRGQCSDL